MQRNELNKIRVTIIEDDSFFVSIIVSRLNNIGIKKISIFKSGEAFFEYLNNPADIIILDYNLEKEMTGIDVLKKLKKLDIRTKIIVFTTEKKETIYKECIAFGAQEFIEKGLYSFGMLEMKIKEISSIVIKNKISESRSVLQYIAGLFW